MTFLKTYPKADANKGMYVLCSNYRILRKKKKNFNVTPATCQIFPKRVATRQIPGRGGGTWVKFCWVCAAGLSEPLPHYSLFCANYRPHLSLFWANVIVILRTEFNASRLLNIKTTAGTIFQPRIFLFLNPCLPEVSYPKNPENLRPHSSNSTKNVTPL